MKIKYVFFDLGLTLVHNNMPSRYREALKRCGKTINDEDADKAYHLANKYFMRYRQGRLNKKGKYPFSEYVLKFCESIGIPEWAVNLEEELRKIETPAEWICFPYTKAVLKELNDSGIKTGLISNWDETAGKVLESNGLKQYLSPVIISSELGVEKPDLKIFQAALDEAGCLPEECLYVGDNYYDDKVGADKLGINCVILNPKGRKGIEELEDSVEVFENITYIPAYVRKIENGF